MSQFTTDPLTPTQLAILEKAKEHFLRDGFKSASLRQIVKEAGFTQGAFYGYYSSKEELFCAITRETAEGIIRLLKSISDDMDQYPAEVRMLYMSDCYTKRLPELVDFMYDHHEELVLLMTRSEGTRYENFLGKIQNMSESNTMNRISSSPVALPIHPAALQAVMDTYYTTVFGILLKNLPREDTCQALIDVQNFYRNGLLGMIPREQQQTATVRREENSPALCERANKG